MSAFEAIASALHIPEMVVFYKSRKATLEQLKAAEKYLLEPFDGYEIVKPDVTVGFGVGCATPILARRIAEAAAHEDNVGSKFIFTGGVGVHHRVLSASIVPQMKKHDLEIPKSCKTEAECGAHVFASEYKKITGKDANDRYEILCENKSTNAQQACANVKDMIGDLGGKRPYISLVSIPCCAHRMLMTAMHEIGLNPVYMPVLAWLPEIGITREGWMQNPLARVETLGDYRRIGPSKEHTAGLYVDKGFCTAVDLPAYLNHTVPFMRARQAALASQL